MHLIAALVDVVADAWLQRYADRGEIALVDDSSRAKHVSSLAYDSFIGVLA